MLKEGIILGERYEILSRVGSGGMADVYKANDHKLNRLVAVKVMKAEFREDKSFVSKFQKEAQSAAMLSHPNVVNVFDVGEDRGLYYIVMELVEGITLKNYITKKGKLSVKEATSIAIQVALGLQAAHNRGIVHRDVKPQNIIISTDGKVKLSDFGIAKATNSNTITTNVMGSVHYSSPEQVRGGMSDARSDIYSLGITMYEMVTGRVPFDGDTTVAIAIKHLQEEMVPPSKYTPDLPHALEQIILKATMKTSNKRYQNVGDMIEDLKRSLLEPDGDFVVMNRLSDPAGTVKISEKEMNDVRDSLERDKKKAKQKKQKHQPIVIENDYEEEDKGGSKLEKGLTIGGFLVGIIIIAALIFFIANMAGLFDNSKDTSVSSSIVKEESVADEQVTVPSFLGMTLEDAIAQANALGIGVKQVATESSDVYAEGTILYQNIAEGTKVDKQTTIEVTVSGGISQITIPSGLAGMPQADAEKILNDMGLTTVVELQASDSVPVGSVVSTNPSEGSVVSPGASVTVYVSSGSGGESSGEQVTVPNVSGETQERAISALSALGLNYSISSGSSDLVGANEVISTTPEAGSQVPAGSTVTIIVNDGGSSDSSDSQSEDSYVSTGTLARPDQYNGGRVTLELVQNGITSIIYQGSNPWTSGDYSSPIYSSYGTNGTINVYEDNSLIARYPVVTFRAA
ncbi:MAG TPA: Stk1 family PASTA domain-containing Ser/Thr kinase [Lachnospiraceae bacterium]|nr:Stk1 family PASTA domain-containing Ser/Thr kinase [Lachnospiraceae bacterium]